MLLVFLLHYDRIASDRVLSPEKGAPRSLPDVFAMRGLLQVDTYFPSNYVLNPMDKDERYWEATFMIEECKERVPWLEVGLARAGT